MRTLSRLALVASLILPAAACGTSSSEGLADAAVDSPQLPRVQRVNCPATVAVEITEVGTVPGPFNYSPNPARVKVGGIVRFRSGAIHQTRSVEAGLFEIEPGQTECYKFNTRETHQIFCLPHGFIGSIIVQ
jgi:plastocyanin